MAAAQSAAGLTGMEDISEPAPGRCKVHLVGIGGVGMAALSVLLKSRGWEVSGCDFHFSPRTRWLESEGIRVFRGHDAAHVRDADLVVATPAVDRGNPELLAARRLVSRGEMLARIVGSCDSIAVCGSHGKTTTATFTAKLLLALGEGVGWAIGGETGDFPVGRAPLAGGPLVVEADESDGTLALYHARTLVVTNCEYDHPDHFRTREAYFACYDEARRNAGAVIEAESLADAGLPRAVLDAIDGLAAHNRRNARAAIEVALRRGHSPADVAAALPSAVKELPDRRFERIWPSPAVYTDYAHHPTEMRCAIGMARAGCRGVLRVLFQPHRYSRTKALAADFPAALAGADEVVLCPTYPAFEKPVEGGDVADLYLACRESWRGAAPRPRLFLARSCAEAWKHAFLESGPDDMTLLLGAGDIIKLVPRVREDMEKPGCGGAGARRRSLAEFSFFGTGGETAGGGARRVVGAGSNTWISDLTTDEEYFRLPRAGGGAPAGKPGEAIPAGVAGASLGIPWMAGIPGTVGGWVKMNAGAFGHEIGELVEKVRVDGAWVPREECGFGYRTSAIRGIVEEVVFSGFGEGGAEAAARFLAARRRFPPRCCGSVFRNPPGGSAGRLLEEAGAKGLRVGGAYVWEGHANVIAAGDGATSSDILALARILRERVRHRFGTVLEPEICGLEM